MEEATRLVDLKKINLFKPPPFFRKWEQQEIIPKKLFTSDPAKILNLCESLQGLDFKAIELKICSHLAFESHSDSVFLIHITYDTEEAIVYTANGKIFELNLRYALDKDVLESLEIYENNICDLLDVQIQDVLFNITLFKKVQVISVPVKSKNDYRVKLLACAINSKLHISEVVCHIQETFRYTLTLLVNTKKYSEENRVKLQCQQLLSYARRLFLNLTDVNDLLVEIMYEAKQLCNAERCSLFLLDNDNRCLVAKVFDGIKNSETLKEIRLSRDQGICGHVAVTGEIINIKNAYKHPLFYKGMDDITGFKTRNILCFPIRDEHGIIGVAQLCNKVEGNFNVYDEEAASAFSTYCGLAITHGLLYKKIKDEQARNKLSTELMMYHMRLLKSDIDKVLNCTNEHNKPGWTNITFSVRLLPFDETVCYALKMFDMLNLIKKFHIKYETLIKFILYVQKGYRDAPYHNWLHGFSVCHFAFITILNFRMIHKKIINELEALALLISTLAHDLDHRGTTNQFQLQSESNLASLYSSEGSVMERHHLAQCIFILNTEGCNILENLKSKEYMVTLNYISELILATDLANHLKLINKQNEMAILGYNRTNAEHRKFLLSLIMTCADLSDQTKDWSIVKISAECIYMEFFSQGDVEKELGRKPIAMMDREKADIPNDQICFINYVALPAYQTFAIIFPEAEIFVKSLQDNIECWRRTIPIFETYWNTIEDHSIQISKSGTTEEEDTNSMDESNEYDDYDTKTYIVPERKSFNQNIAYMFKKI